MQELTENVLNINLILTFYINTIIIRNIYDQRRINSTRQFD